MASIASYGRRLAAKMRTRDQNIRKLATARSHQNGKVIKVECQECYEESGSHTCIRPAHKVEVLKAAMLGRNSHAQANPPKPRRVKKHVFKPTIDPNTGQPNDEVIPDVLIEMDENGLITSAKITVRVPPLRKLSPKKFLEHIKGAVELEIELLKEVL